MGTTMLMTMGTTMTTLMATDIQALLQLIWLASPALPVGGFSYSEGLEAAIDHGLVQDEASCTAWLRDQLLLTQARGDMAAMALAFLVNLLAFPFSLGLLPYVANNIYLTDQTGLGWLGASFAFGGLVGSVVLSSHRFAFRAAQTMVLAGAVWFAVNVLFAFSTHLGVGMALLCLAGLAQSLCMTPLAAVMLRATEPTYRGRVMGMRMLAIWGLPLGLLLSGPLIERWGYAATAGVYSALGLLLTGAMAGYWRAHVWDAKAPANAAL